ncbi:MAG: hypothetical protein EXR65_02495 [Dehalococcoidia bacterium]|nr:hypothetical protein [Dehalococcoidia bacterium]
MPDNHIEREINEILSGIEYFPSAQSRYAHACKWTLRRTADAFSDWQRSVAQQLARVSISQVVLLSFLMIIGSFFFRRFSPVLTAWVLLAGGVLFAVSFAALVFSSRGGGSAQPRYWRGRELSYRSAPLSTRIRRWLSNHSRR